MNMKNLQIITLIATAMLLSCTEKEVIVPDFVAPESDRVVLLEELTGVSCPNCPSGAAKVEDLLQLYEGQLVVMAIHGDFDAEPLEGYSKYDFRNEEGKELEDYLKPFYGKPSAAINRVSNSGGELGIIGVDTWGGYIEDELAKAHTLDIALDTEYDENTRELTVQLGILPLHNLDGNFNFSVAITESHIIDAQKNQSEIIPEFEHMRVFRKMLTDVKGDALGSDLEANKILNKKLSYTLPVDDDLWVAENCNVVAFVTRIEGDTKHVLQAAEAAVVE
jgi:thiol-disulfide isomerase/thioredoxin